MVSPNYHINFVVQTVIKLLNKRDVKILYVVSHSGGLKPPYTKLKINPLERRIPKMLQKSQILNFHSYTPTPPPHLLNGLRKFEVKLSKNPCLITMAIVQ